MKLSVLGESAHTYRKKLQRQIGLCVAAVILTLGINILFTALRTDSNHIWMLSLNITADILCGLPLLYFVTVHLAPRYRLYRLYLRKAGLFIGTVEHIALSPTRYMDMNCYEITADGRKLFLPANTITLEESRQYRFHLVSNTIVEVEL